MSPVIESCGVTDTLLIDGEIALGGEPVQPVVNSSIVVVPPVWNISLNPYQIYQSPVNLFGKDKSLVYWLKFSNCSKPDACTLLVLQLLSSQSILY